MNSALKIETIAESLVIRRATMDDASAVFNFICALEEEPFNYPVFEGLYEKNINDPENIYLIVADNNTIAGYLSCHGQILLHHAGKVFEIQELYVDEKYRSRGIGARLIQTLEKILEGEGCLSLEVSSNVRRTRAHKFYVDCGFIPSHIKLTKAMR